MKLLNLNTICILSAFAGITQGQAKVFEINERENTIYLHPNPELKIKVMDLQSDGGILSAFLDYGTQSKKEIQELKNKFPNYAIQVLTAFSASDTLFEIPEIGLRSLTPKRQGQFGPYLNLQIAISRQQTQDLKKMLASKKTPRVVFENLVTSQYKSLSLLERQSFSPEACSWIHGNTLGEVFLKQAQFTRPTLVEHEETFKKLRREILDYCYSLTLTKVSSFQELFELPATKKEPTQNLVIETYSMQNKDIQYLLEPILDFGED